MKLSKFSLCAVLLRILGRTGRILALLEAITLKQDSLMGKADEIKAIQEQDLQEGRETAAAGAAAIQRLTNAVTALTDKIAGLEANTVTDAQVADLKTASDAAKAISDDVQAAFDAAGA